VAFTTPAGKIQKEQATDAAQSSWLAAVCQAIVAEPAYAAHERVRNNLQRFQAEQCAVNEALAAIPARRTALLSEAAAAPPVADATAFNRTDPFDLLRQHQERLEARRSDLRDLIRDAYQELARFQGEVSKRAEDYASAIIDQADRANEQTAAAAQSIDQAGNFKGHAPTLVRCDWLRGMLRSAFLPSQLTRRAVMQLFPVTPPRPPEMPQEDQLPIDAQGRQVRDIWLDARPTPALPRFLVGAHAPQPSGGGIPVEALFAAKQKEKSDRAAVEAKAAATVAEVAAEQAADVPAPVAAET
jgi:hypothetical protein